MGGYLLLGHAETLWQISDDFSLLPVGEAFVYRKDAVPQGGHRPALTRPTQPAPQISQPRRVVREVLRVPGLRPKRAMEPPSPPPAPRAVPSPLEDLIKARAALHAGRYEEAASLAERATAAHPMLVEGYIIEGRALSNQGDDDGAIAALRKAVFLDPEAAHAHFLLATTRARVGDPGGAALSFAAAAQTLPGASPETLSELLDGRAVSDLVDLCRQLAVSIDTGPAAPVGAGSASRDDGRRRP
jgi:chemotaxis protein methyltransferase CheR